MEWGRLGGEGWGGGGDGWLVYFSVPGASSCLLATNNNSYT